ncbi:MAG TPA: hypothetical protein P5150_01315 [Candidatus Ratteibacteria bacterium]|nr:hypothetical protein [bacterium]HRR95359.1 hypothetical protein [Candidatus Ratteibacteria bacterium]
MSTEIKERIEVNAIFTKNKLKILWFKWKERKYFVKNITFSWKKHSGDKEIYLFDLSNGIDVFEISFIPENLTWYLEKIYTY